MLTTHLSLPLCLRVFALWLLISVHAFLYAQVEPTVIATGVSRIEGGDPDNHVAYTRIFLNGALVPPAETSPPPTLAAQCMRQPSGKLAFELSTNFEGVEDRDYHRPRMPKDGGTFASQVRR